MLDVQAEARQRLKSLMN